MPEISKNSPEMGFQSQFSPEICQGKRFIDVFVSIYML
jgi:hypothetical protein